MPKTAYTYLVTVVTETQEQAEQVISERIYQDEHYGFDYQLSASNEPLTVESVEDDESS